MNQKTARSITIKKIAFLSFIISLPAIHVWSESVTIYATCKTLGLLEQCGCATDIEGGLEARAGFLQKARQETPDAILIDDGGFMPLRNQKKKPALRLPNENDVNQALGSVNLQAMKLMQYDIVLLSPSDLLYGSDVLRPVFPPKNVYLGSNIDTRDDWISPIQVRECNGLKIGFVGAVSLSAKTKTIGREFTLLSPEKTISQSIEHLRQNENVDAVILLAHEPPPTVQKWLTGYQGPKIGLIVTLDFGISVNKSGGTFITNAPGKGRAIGKIVLDIEKGRGIKDVRYQRIPLYPSRYSNDAMRGFLTKSYSEMIGQLNLNKKQETGGNTDNGYMGGEICMGCHIEEYEQWKTTRHASAFYELLDQTRHWIPECIECHVTGYGHKEGFQQFPLSKNLMQVQCESCHGPGRKHVDEFGMGQIQRIPEKDLCLKCHTEKFSPKFNSMYDLYYKQIVHE